MARRMLPRTLFARSLLIIVTPLVLLQVVSTAIFYERHWDTILRRLTGAVAGEIGFAIAAMERFPGEASRADLLALLARHTRLRATFEPGARLDAPGAGPAGPLARALAGTGRPFAIDAESREREILIDVQLDRGVLRVVAPRKRLFSSTTTIWVLWMVGSSLILFAVAGLFMRSQVRPVRLLAQAADAFGRGREAEDPRIAGAAEVRQANIAFRRMRERIRREADERTEMLAGVSHDMRAPLARMRLALELMPESEEVAELRDDVAEMTAMLDAYLAFARGQGGEAAVETDLANLVEEVVAGARRSGAAIDLSMSGEAPTLEVRATALRRCLANLIDNAARHGDQVWVRCRSLPGRIEIDVDDDGPGVPEAERERVFRPFHRLDRARGPGAGAGLGLAIARDAVVAHGGAIRLVDSPEGGLGVRVVLPA